MIPSTDDLKNFLEKKRFANFSQIARRFDINNITVSELVKSLEKENLVSIERVGQYKFVKMLK